MVTKLSPVMTEDRYGDYVSIDDYLTLKDELTSITQNYENLESVVEDLRESIEELKRERDNLYEQVEQLDQEIRDLGND